MRPSFIVIFVTAKDAAEGERIAKALLAAELVACANIVPGVKSLFRWQGRVDEAQETLLILKSTQERFASIVDMVKKNHSYDVPEIIALPVTDGSGDYLSWVADSVKGGM